MQRKVYGVKNWQCFAYIVVTSTLTRYFLRTIAADPRHQELRNLWHNLRHAVEKRYAILQDTDIGEDHRVRIGRCHFIHVNYFAKLIIIIVRNVRRKIGIFTRQVLITIHKTKRSESALYRYTIL